MSAVVLDVVEPNLVLVPAPDAVRRIELQREAQKDGVGLADACVQPLRAIVPVILVVLTVQQPYQHSFPPPTEAQARTADLLAIYGATAPPGAPPAGPKSGPTPPTAPAPASARASTLRAARLDEDLEGEVADPPAGALPALTSRRYSAGAPTAEQEGE